MLSRFALAVLALALAGLPWEPARAQSVVTGTSIAPEADSPDLFFGFFHLQVAVSQASRTDPSVARSAARTMGITDDLSSVAAVSEGVVAELAEIRAHAVAARQAASPSSRPELAKRFESQRRAALEKAIDSLRRQLAPESWAALRAFVNGRYLRSIHSETITAR